MADGMLVLDEGAYSIRWHGGATFNVFLFEKEVNVFTHSTALEGEELTEDEAREVAGDWWRSGGKVDTQNVVQNEGW